MTPKELEQLTKLAYAKADQWFETCINNAASIENQMQYCLAFTMRVNERIYEWTCMRGIFDAARKLPPLEDDEE